MSFVYLGFTYKLYRYGTTESYTKYLRFSIALSFNDLLILTLSTILISLAMLRIKKMIETLNTKNAAMQREKYKLNPLATFIHCTLLVAVLLISILQLVYILAGNADKQTA